MSALKQWGTYLIAAGSPVLGQCLACKRGSVTIIVIILEKGMGVFQILGFYCAVIFGVGAGFRPSLWISGKTCQENFSPAVEPVLATSLASLPFVYWFGLGSPHLIF